MQNVKIKVVVILLCVTDDEEGRLSS